MLETLYTFSALSIAGTVILSLLPEGSIRRTAAMVTGLLALLCWAESFLGLLNWSPDASVSASILMQTHFDIGAASAQAAADLEAPE